MKPILSSNKLRSVSYDIRGPVQEKAYHMEEEGHRITKLNIGNPAPFNLLAPDEILQDIVHNLAQAQGYSESKGLYSARKAVMQACQRQGLLDVQVGDIYLGNGVSELIVMSMQALLNSGDEVLLPSPDYPLWTAATVLGGGTPVHYACDELAGWQPDLEDIRSKVTSHTRAIVVINPNNPTGAVYSKEILEGIIEIAREHDLIVFSDEIYDKILYDDAVHIPLATLSEDVLTLTFNGLSKAYRLAGFRSGWMYLSGPKHRATDYIKGLDILASMRLCANVPAMYGVQTALGGYQSIQDLVAPGGRLRQQRDLTVKMINDIPGLSCQTPKGALYCFVRIDPEKFKIQNDEQMALDLLTRKKILIAHGGTFNHTDTQHFRVVFLPSVVELRRAFSEIGDFFADYEP
ncbi:MAG: pyridoxal phosphate-dependent aminotransferase [Bacteroidota bacterium]